MSNQNGHDVENNYKDASEKFLNFMKETRQKDKSKEEDDDPAYMDAAVNVSNFVYELTSKCSDIISRFSLIKLLIFCWLVLFNLLLTLGIFHNKNFYALY